jgi:heme-degrading monooxygenase HmoA
MVLQCARLDIRPGSEADFERAFREAEPLIIRQSGLRWVRLERCLENRSRYLFLAEWERLEDHTEVFPASEEYPRWSALLHPFYEPPPTVEHFESLNG